MYPHYFTLQINLCHWITRAPIYRLVTIDFVAGKKMRRHLGATPSLPIYCFNEPKSEDAYAEANAERSKV
jgi:hypothetical protein